MTSADNTAESTADNSPDITTDPTFVPRRKRSAHPEVRRIELEDLLDAIVKGLADFNAMPTHLVFLAIVYPIMAFSVAGFYGNLNMLPFIFPLVAGYTLLGPLVATGMYELSRRREFGRYTSRTNAFLVFKSHSIIGISILGLILMGIYAAWIYAARFVYVAQFGTGPVDSYLGFASQVLTTEAGVTMIVVGSAIGLVFAIVVLSFSVVSFPMLLDLDVDVYTAVQTSVRAVALNPIVMAIWGIIVGASLFIGALPFFVGLGIVLPVLGHSTWHLYRKLVES